MDTVTVVINVFKRGPNFEKQLAAINSQSHPVHEVLVWENGHDSSGSARSGTKRSRSDFNFGVWARFSYALNATSDFIWMIDDDTIPGVRFLESALETFEANNGVIGSRGIRFRTKNSYHLYDEVGTHKRNDQTEQVDLVGHNWIFPRAWLGVFWAEYERKFEGDLAGEDMHLSFAVQKHLGLGTFVPPHPANEPERWGEVGQDENAFDGTDRHAISLGPNSDKRFENAFQHYVSNGWKMMYELEGNQPRSIDMLASKAIAANPKLVRQMAKVLGLRKPR